MKTSKSSHCHFLKNLWQSSFLKFFLFIFLILTFCGCGHHHSNSVIVPEKEELLLNLRGKVNLNNIKFPTILCDNNSYQFRDLSVFNLSIQDDLKSKAYINSNGEFSFPTMEPRQQIVIFCTNASNTNLVFEWMGASSSGLTGQIDASISINSTARSLIARTLRDLYGKRIKPELIPDEYIIKTVEAIVQVIEQKPELLKSTALSEIDSIKTAYTEMAELLYKGDSGSYPNDHIFLFYFAGDNDLCINMENSVNKIAEAGLPANTQIIIGLDTSHSLPLLNKSGAARYKVNDHKLELLNELGDVDSTNPLVLEKFIEISMREYPGKDYSLFLSSHGGSWRERERNLSNKRAVFMNDTTSLATGTVLNIANAVEKALSNVGTTRKFSMIVLDACNMGCIETAYEFSNLSNYTVFSQELMPASGMPYDEFFIELAKNETNYKSDYNKAEVLCDLYCKKYVNVPNVINTGISIIDNSAFPEFINCCKNYCNAINTNLVTNASLLYNIRTQKTTNDGEIISGDVIQSFSPLKEFIDFKQLIDESYNKILDVKVECDALKSSFNSLIKYSKYSNSLKNANGISITFPEKDIYKAYYKGILPADEYFHLKFNTFTSWYKILDAILIE